MKFLVARFSATVLFAAPFLWGQARSPKDFQFTEVDERLLAEVELVDRQFEKKGLILNDPALDTHIENLAKPVIEAAGTPDRVRWKFRVLRDPSVNAFAMPNGSIYLNSGLLSLLENDAQLAGVLAHEITHVTNRHTYQHYRSYRKKMVALHVLAAAAPFAPVNTAWGAAIYVIGSVSQPILVATIFGYNRELEREADTFAIDRVAAAGWDPLQLPATFRLMDEKLEVEPVETFYRSHPKLEERIAYTESLARGKTPPDRERSSAQTYLAAVERAIRFNVQADIDSRRFRTALNRGQRLVDLRPGDPDNIAILADAWRSLGARTTAPTERELTGRGKSDARKLAVQRTLAEEEKELLARPDGPDTRRANLEKAEDLYRQAIAANPAHAKSWQGLGLLYEDRGRDREARESYHKYLELAPNAADSLRIQRRLAALEKTLQPPVR